VRIDGGTEKCELRPNCPTNVCAKACV